LVANWGELASFGHINLGSRRFRGVVEIRGTAECCKRCIGFVPFHPDFCTPMNADVTGALV